MGNFNAHIHFLRTLELNLFEKVALRFLRNLEAQSWRQKELSLYALGFYLSLVFGAAEMLTQQAGLHAPPPIWGFKLDAGDWPDCRGFLFHTKELWAEGIFEECGRVPATIAGHRVSVIC